MPMADMDRALARFYPRRTLLRGNSNRGINCIRNDAFIQSPVTPADLKAAIEAAFERNALVTAATSR